MKIHEHYGWQTHTPMIKAVLDICSPKYILELGSGFHSTPLFLQSGAKVTVIENSLEWYEEIKKTLNPPDYRLHEINESNETNYQDISKSKRVEIIDYYLSLIPEIESNDGFRLLFVDQFTCNRIISINELYSYFDAVIYHDCQPTQCYNYDLIYAPGYTMIMSAIPNSWTGLLLKSLNRDIIDRLDMYVREFCITHGINESMDKFKNI